jgi:transposase, IS5 family
LLRRRAGIEAIVSHLKNRHGLSRNYLSGDYGDEINVMLASAGFNFKKWMRKIKITIFYLIKLLKKEFILNCYC